jgi:hypothetical protein
VTPTLALPPAYAAYRRPGVRTNPACDARRHGDSSAYQKYGCRCPEARNTHRIRQKRARHGTAQPALVDSTGTARRIQGMVAVGWTYQHIADRLGLTSPTSLGPLARLEQPTVHIVTARKIAVVAADLGWRPGPSEQSRRRARAKGWLPLAAWPDGAVDDPHATPDTSNNDDGGSDAPVVDWLAIDLALNGQPVPLRTVDRHYAVHIGLQRGMTQWGVAERLRMGADTVRRLAGRQLPQPVEAVRP